MRERNWKSRAAILIACLIMVNVLASAQNASAADISSSALVEDCESNADAAFNSSTEESNMSSQFEMVGPVFDESLLSGAGTNDTIMATHTFSVSGEITYTERDGEIRKLRRVKVTIWDKDLLIDDQIGGNYYTDDNGNFATGPLSVSNIDGDFSGPDLYIKVHSESVAAAVKDSSIYTISTANNPVNNWESGNCAINLHITEDNVGDVIGAFRAHDAAMEGYIWVTETVFPIGHSGGNPPQVSIHWPSSNLLYVPDYFPHNKRQIHLKETNANYPDQVLHEYGHYIMDFYYDWPDWGITNFDYGQTIFDRDNTMIAWLEGWANYFAARANINLIDGEARGDFARYTYFDEVDVHYDFEHRTTTNPAEATATHPQNGTDVIMCVAAFLVDLADGNNEGLEKSTYTDGWIHHILRDTQFNSPYHKDPRQKRVNEFWNHWNTRYQFFAPSTIHFPRTALYHNEFFTMANNVRPEVTLDSISSWVSGVITIRAAATDDNQEDIPYQTMDFQYSLDGMQSWIDISTGISGGGNGVCIINWNTIGINAGNIYVRVRTFDDMEYSEIGGSDWRYSNPFGIDNIAPGTPSITSTHTENQWSGNNNPAFTWGAISDVSGITYYYDWNNNPTSIPTSASQSTEGITTSFSNTPDGTWYLHARARDGAGNWGGTGHYGPVLIDTSPPGSLTVSSSTHVAGEWSANVNPSFSWTAAATSSPPITYHYVLNQVSNTVPDAGSASTTLTTVSFSSISEGHWYFHLIPRDSVGNWGGVNHFGPIKIDTTGPSPQGVPTEGSPDMDWGNGEYTVYWEPAVDQHVSVAQCEIQENVNYGATWQTIGYSPTNSYSVTGRNIDGNFYRYRIRAQDTLGNWDGWSGASDGIKIDTVPPDATVPIKQSVWEISNPSFIWPVPNDYGGGVSGGSGVIGYDWRVDSGAVQRTPAHCVQIPAQQPGDHVFQVRAVDAAGNVAEWGSCAFFTRIGVFGRVINEDNTATYMPDTTIEILDGANQVIASTLTDAVGWYAIGLLPEGAYKIRVSKFGFTTQTDTFTIDHALDSHVIDIYLRYSGGLAYIKGRLVVKHIDPLAWLPVAGTVYIGTRTMLVDGAFTFAVNTAPGYGYQIACIPTELSPRGYQYIASPSGISVGSLSPGQTVTILDFKCNELIPTGFFGCPYVSVWNGDEYIRQNSVLPASETPIRDTLDVEDHILLDSSLVPRDGMYTLLLEEFEYDVSHLDSAQLMTIDHSSEMNVGITQDGRIYYWSDPQPPVSCFDEYSNDRLSSISGLNDGMQFDGVYGSSLEIGYDIPTGASEARLVINADKAPAPVVPSWVEGMIYGPIVIQVCREDGEWVEVSRFYPRAKWSMEIVDITQHLPTYSNELAIRLLWEGYHPLDYIGIDFTVQNEIPIVTEYQLTSATHWGKSEDTPTLSFKGDVTEDMRLRDGNHVVMIHNDQIHLEFPYVPPVGIAREVVLVLRGYYEIPYKLVKGIDIGAQMNASVEMRGSSSAHLNVTFYEDGLPVGHVYVSSSVNGTQQTKGRASFLLKPGHKYEAMLDYDTGDAQGINSVEMTFTGPTGIFVHRILFNAVEGCSQDRWIALTDDIVQLAGVYHESDYTAVKTEIKISLALADLNCHYIQGWREVLWDFGDNYRINGTASRVFHTYRAPGNYTLRATITYDDGEKVTITRNILAYEGKYKNLAPVPEIGVFQEIEINLLVAGRKDNTVGIRIYEDGILIHSVDVTRTAGQLDTVTLKLDRYLGRIYEVELVYDAAHRGANPTWLEFSSGGVSLTYFKEFDTKDGFSQAITIDSSYLENVVASTPTFRFDASGSYDMDGEIVSYEWDFGDGTVAQGIAAEYIYTAPGTYEVTLTVTDDDGLASTVSVMVTYAVPVTIQPLPGPSKSSF